MFGDFKEKFDVSSRPDWQEIPSIGKESERPYVNTEQPWKADGDIETSRVESSYESERPQQMDLEPEKVSTYQDDNGEVYRINDELLPNNSYEINGYQYETDGLGRIKLVEGLLRLKNHEGRLTIKDEISVIGKGDEKETDDRGHLIGDQFDGSNGMENLLPQDAQLNRVEFRNFENQLASEVKQGKDVYYKIEPIYEGESRRPDSYVVTYSINGEKNVRFFENGKEGF